MDQSYRDDAVRLVGSAKQLTADLQRMVNYFDDGINDVDISSDLIARGTVFEPDVFRSYDESDAELFNSFVAPDIKPVAGCFTDFLGRITDCRFLPTIRHLEGKSSTFIPIPGDGFYADAIEYVGLLEAYSNLATDRFVCVEIGAGWGPWIAAAGVIGRRRKIGRIDLIGVEASLGKIAFMKQHLQDNMLRPRVDELDTVFEAVHSRCVRGAIWTEDGEVQFPVVVAEQDYGGWVPTDSNEPSIGARTHEAVPAYTIQTLLEPYPVVDFMHIDIQGSEVNVCTQAIDFLRERVRYLFIGTHSRSIEGSLTALLLSNSFLITREKPCRFNFSGWSGDLERLTCADGGQLWVNQKFR